MAKAFVDTNVLFYAVDGREGAKQEIAIRLIGDLLQSSQPIISAQVVHEFLINIIRKLGLSPEQALTHCAGLREFALAPTTLDTARESLLIMGSASLSFRDACIVSAAAQSGCKVLYSEDLNSGQTIAGVKIVNPFL
ncbi:MAG: PIN domain-containing protein [Fimbriimonas sp.]